jgi:hypothetical protein
MGSVNKQPEKREDDSVTAGGRQVSERGHKGEQKGQQGEQGELGKR